MARDATDIRVAGDALIYLAPLGTAFPTWDTPPADPWVELGYVTPDGVTFNFGREVTEIFAMQSAEPVRIVNTRTPRTVAFSMMQQGADQLILALGGGSVAADGLGGAFRFTPPDASVVDERAMIVEMVDGAFTYRWEMGRVQNREGVEEKLMREDSLNFPVTMQILVPSDGSASFELVTDDPAYDPAGLLLANGNGQVVDQNGEPSNGDPEAYDSEAEPTADDESAYEPAPA